jgi:hypothetical protein
MSISLKDVGTPAGQGTDGAIRVWAGRGTGRPCAHCGEAISATGVQYDLEITEALAAVTDALRGRTLSFHLNCYDQWREGLEEQAHSGRG